ncbi:MAG: metallopeptidase family protein [Actinomycetes bacterium]
MRPHPSSPAREPVVPLRDQGGRRRRDRRGHGLRGPLAPERVPLARTRAERFDDLVERSVGRLEQRWERELSEVEFAVAEVPPARQAVRQDDDEQVLLARTYAAAGDNPARVVVYRRPLEARASDPQDLEALVHDVIVEEVADLLGLNPQEIDPGYGEGLDDEDG